MKRIQPIVEGHGDVRAVPVLLRRLRDEAQAFDVEINEPIRRKYSELITQTGIQKAVELALLQQDCAAILIVFDCEDFCPKELAPKLLGWAKAAARAKPCEVVLAYREYETWFLAALESLRGRYGIPADAAAPANPEGRRDAKGALEEYMERGFSYDETVDQPRFSAAFDMGLAYRRSRSFRKLVKTFGTFISPGGGQISAWPPAQWTRDV